MLSRIANALSGVCHAPVHTLLQLSGGGGVVGLTRVLQGGRSVWCTLLPGSLSCVCFNSVDVSVVQITQAGRARLTHALTPLSTNMSCVPQILGAACFNKKL